MIKLNVTKLLKNVSLKFTFSGASNRIVVFGPSGSGKTLLLKMIAGFFDPEQGEISVDDHLLFSKVKNVSVPIYRRNIGYLPQEYTLFPNMSVRENILYGLKARKLSIDQKKFETLVDRLDIASKLDIYPDILSGGQKQRAALARALLVNPRTLLLDEPFSALDSSIRESLRDLVIDIADEMNIVTLFVTHDLEEAFIFGKEIVLVNKGRVIEFGQSNTVFYGPENVATASLMGFVNIWPVSHLPGKRVKTDHGIIFSYKGDFSKDKDFLCIRPENIMFLREDKPYKANIKENIVSGVISSIHHRGRYINVELVTPEGMIFSINVPEHAFSRLKLERNKLYQVSLKEESIVLCKRKQNPEIRQDLKIP